MIWGRGLSCGRHSDGRRRPFRSRPVLRAWPDDDRFADLRTAAIVVWSLTDTVAVSTTSPVCRPTVSERDSYLLYRRMSSPLSFLLLLLCCDSAIRVHCFNLETRLPIVKRSLEVSYFGYSVAGHQSYDEIKLQVENSWLVCTATSLSVSSTSPIVPLIRKLIAFQVNTFIAITALCR